MDFLVTTWHGDRIPLLDVTYREDGRPPRDLKDQPAARPKKSNPKTQVSKTETWGTLRCLVLPANMLMAVVSLRRGRVGGSDR